MPNIICIMNESLSDLGALGNLETNEDYMPFIHSLTENTIKGYLSMPVFGAGTSNSEFEFLSGDSISFLPTGCNVYQSYVKGFGSVPGIHPWLSWLFQDGVPSVLRRWLEPTQRISAAWF